MGLFDYVSVLIKCVSTATCLPHVRGDVKIFDFGLAKELNPAMKDMDGMYALTADTGSPRYMAPEVFLGQPYNELVDVYSFTTLMWQILKLETPYQGYTMSLLKKKVMVGGARLKCDPKWPQQLNDLMHRGWGNPMTRPNMEEVLEVLRSEMNQPRSGGIHELDMSRKSSQSLMYMK
jgi:serine/threonine protein kinase